MLCVYGIVRADHPGVAVDGVQGRPTSCVQADDLAAIVSEVDGELLARRRDVEAHLAVLEAALAAGDVLPFRFGTLVEGESAMRSVLADSGAHYRALLERLGGFVQVTVKAVRDDDEAVRTVVESDERLRRAVARWRNSSVWARRVALGEQIADAVEQLSSRDARLILDRLASFAADVSVQPATAPTVVSAALLVQPGNLAELDSAVAALTADFGDRLSFDHAGPMPAYSFVT